MSDTARQLERVVDLQRRIHISLLSSLTENWMAVDYTMPQLKVLLCLLINGPYRMGNLASALGVSTATTTGIVNRLVSRGVVARSHGSQDRRVVTCFLSPAGEGVISALWTARFNVYRELFSSLSPEELEIVTKAAELVLKAAELKNAGAKMNEAETALVG